MSHPSPNPPNPGSEPSAAARQTPPDLIRILHLEDDPTTTDLVRERLRHEGLQVEIERVETLPEFAQRLASRSHALILSDFTIPGTNTLEALRLAHTTRPDLPYIFLSGTLGEDNAVEALKQGATDYVLKDRIARLGPAVRRALQEAQEHARRTQAEEALQQNEAKFRSLFEHSPDAIFLTIPDGRIIAANPAARAMFGMTLEEIFGWGSGGGVAGGVGPPIEFPGLRA